MIGKYNLRKIKFAREFKRRKHSSGSALAYRNAYCESLNEFITAYNDDDDLRDLMNVYHLDERHRTRVIKELDQNNSAKKNKGKSMIKAVAIAQAEERPSGSFNEFNNPASNQNISRKYKFPNNCWAPASFDRESFKERMDSIKDNASYFQEKEKNTGDPGTGMKSSDLEKINLIPSNAYENIDKEELFGNSPNVSFDRDVNPSKFNQGTVLINEDREKTINVDQIFKRETKYLRKDSKNNTKKFASADVTYQAELLQMKSNNSIEISQNTPRQTQKTNDIKNNPSDQKPIEFERHKNFMFYFPGGNIKYFLRRINTIVK